MFLIEKNNLFHRGYDKTDTQYFDSPKLSVIYELFYEMDDDLFVALIMQTANTSETSVNMYQTAWRNNPESILLPYHSVFQESSVTEADIKQSRELISTRARYELEEMFRPCYIAWPQTSDSISK